MKQNMIIPVFLIDCKIINNNLNKTSKCKHFTTTETTFHQQETNKNNISKYFAHYYADSKLKFNKNIEKFNSVIA